MRRLLALLLGLAAVVSLAAPASAAPTIELVIAWTDGAVTTQRVPEAQAHREAAELQARPDVRMASIPVPMSAALTPNDNRFPDQWGPVKVRAPEAWDRTTGSSDVIVAVLDSGVEAGHPDLAGAVLPGRDFVDFDDDADDEHGHGTTVAGVVAARGNNSIGVAGYCWSCKILPVRVLDENGDGGSSAIGLGVIWAVDNGADVINMSLSGSGFDPGLGTAISYALARGVPVVASSGNDGVATQTYPAAIAGVLSVGASGRSDERASFSNYGSWVDVAAPGEGIATTAFGSRYALNARGTSFSAPAVAGIIALGLSAFPQATRADLETFLLSTSVPIAGGWVSAGRVDAKAYLDRLAQAYTTIVPKQLGGASRIATAVSASTHVRTSSAAVVIARSDSPADALAAAPLAGKLDAPVLLTSRSFLSPEVADEVRRLGATTAWLAGGVGALSAQVEADLRSAGITDVRRLDGASRFDTARLIAEQVGGGSVYVTDGVGWADAVAVSGLAAFTQRPVLLTRPGSLPEETAAALAALGATDAVVVGGPNVVSDAVLTALRGAGVTARRLWGDSRYATSELVAAEAVSAGASVRSTWLATGADWPDALAAGPAAAASGGVLLLLDGRDLSRSPSVTSWLSSRRTSVQELVVVGGEFTVTSGTIASLASALLG